MASSSGWGRSRFERTGRCCSRWPSAVPGSRSRMGESLWPPRPEAGEWSVALAAPAPRRSGPGTRAAVTAGDVEHQATSTRERRHSGRRSARRDLRPEDGVERAADHGLEAREHRSPTGREGRALWGRHSRDLVPRWPPGSRGPEGRRGLRDREIPELRRAGDIAAQRAPQPEEEEGEGCRQGGGVRDPNPAL